MALPSTGSITLNSIRAELGKQGEVNFSLNNAEDGGYVTINPCSTFKPSSLNPTSLSEWWGYDHTQPCVSYEYSSVSCDTITGICDQPFNTGQANQGSTMTPYQNMVMDGDSYAETWEIPNANKFSSAYFLVYKTLQDPVWEFQGTYSPWNGIANRGTLNGTKVPSGIYYFLIEYNDGSGREINSFLYVDTAVTGLPWQNHFSYSSSSSSAACASTTWIAYGYTFPIGVGKYLQTVSGDRPIDFTDTIFLGDAPAGYYKKRYTNNWYQVNSSGLIIATGTC